MPAGLGNDGREESYRPSTELSSVEDESTEPKYGYDCADEMEDVVEPG